jgi:Sulfotransferase domain
VGVSPPTLHVIGAGFGRTGTLSLREALRLLGFDPCDHMVESFANPERFTLWNEALRRKQRGEEIDWRPLMSGYRATVDWPTAFFWRELCEAYPEAKVILTVRDPDRWYTSASATIFNLRSRAEDSMLARVARVLYGLAKPAMQDGYRVVDDVVWDGTFHGRFAEPAYALLVFSEHIREVQETLPPERLLVFDVSEGWAPLCEFLDVPAPVDEPFPHINDTEAFQHRVHEQIVRNVLQFGGATAGGIAGLSALAWFVWRSLRA